MAFNLGKWFSRKKTEIKNENQIVTGLSFEDFRRLFVLGNPGSEINAANAMQAIPVQACCTLIAGGIVSMPLRIVHREVIDGVMMQTPADSHDFWWLFNEQPNSDSTSAQFWEQVVKAKLLWGRARARIIRKSGGRSIDVEELVFVPNDRIQVERAWDAARRRYRVMRYLVRDGVHSYGVLPEDMLDFGGSDGYRAMSDALYSAREAISMTLTIEEYCSKFFDNGGMPRTVLKYPQGTTLDEKQKDALRTAWVKQFGGAGNAALPLVLANGGDAVKLSFTAEEAQMLEARKFQVIEIARAFGVPPFMIGENEKTSAWGTGLEQLSQGFIRYTLGPHITDIEQEINRKMFRTSKTFVDFDEEALARGDMKSLGDWFRQAVGGSQGPGFMAINEVRRRLNLPPVAGGESLYDNKGDSNASSKEPADGADRVEPDQP